ncbi:adenylate/guanylate cyclase domain-containing protein [Aestuariibaculum marinum]|uniref:Tetratricopeptide repeat protein n=1 Tax=Aestuariibaculum marinum TaxID=2683592 RepID=A0A8J6U680_9FLAO|nr:adenylate/guanylate cyclase domain-containing protein [Aestuariibaculum marinum]MBD0822476.1 tetratricopeptide repeat protein [Aestuariibaculum marinum]
MAQSRQLVAIMFTDIEGYTALMQKDEKQAVHIRQKHREVFNMSTKECEGELIQYYGDGTLSVFKSSIAAVNCAIKMQQYFQQSPVIPVRIGIHLGDIIKTETDIIGDAVNVASRIESLAVAGSILVSGKINDDLRNQSEFETKYLDVFEFKNVNQTMPVFAIANEGVVVPNLSEINGKTEERIGKSFKSFKRKAAVLLFVLLAFIATLLITRQQTSNGHQLNELTIAVLPFNSVNLDNNSESFTDGVTDDIITHLSKIQHLQVISRASAMHYKGTEKSIQQIAKELDVNYILEGSVRVNDNQVRINANLVDAASNKNLWANNYDNTMVQIFKLQTDVSKDIANALKIRLSETEESRLNSLPTNNPEAYSVFKEGQMYLHRGGGKVEELKKAEQLFKRATEIDPNFCRAYVGLAETYLEYIFWGRESPKKMLEQASIPALKALAINSNDGGTFGALGAISYYKYQRETAILYLKKAIEINPSYVNAYDKLAWIYAFEGNLKLMEENFNKVIKLDPLSSKYIGDMGQHYYYLGEYQKAIDKMDESLKMFPNNNMLIWMKATNLTGLGKYHEAIELYTSRSVASNTNWMLGYSYGMIGEREKAQDILEYQLNKNKMVYVPPFMIATIYMGLGDVENALTWLEKDYEVGGQGLFFWGLKQDIRFKPLREEPRFQALLSKVN